MYTRLRCHVHNHLRNLETFSEKRSSVFNPQHTTLKYCPRNWLVCVLSLIYCYVAVRRICVVCYIIIICFSSLFSNYTTYVFNILFMFVSCFVFLFSILCILYFCIFVLFCLLFLLLCCLFPIFVPVHRPLPPGGNPIAVNK